MAFLHLKSADDKQCENACEDGDEALLDASAGIENVQTHLLSVGIVVVASYDGDDDANDFPVSVVEWRSGSKRGSVTYSVRKSK